MFSLDDIEKLRIYIQDDDPVIKNARRNAEIAEEISRAVSKYLDVPFKERSYALLMLIEQALKDLEELNRIEHRQDIFTRLVDTF